MTSFLTTLLHFGLLLLQHLVTLDVRQQNKNHFRLCLERTFVHHEQASLNLVMGPQKQFKIVIIGDPCVGKTCLLTLFTNGTCKRHLGPIL